ncbi:MAG: hypothetical protein EPO08_19475 [Rhodospirillaceae bacterium]|nr:MAG: hypothetical protein EPO08_19475 [Rhodospirillaceae bacterium]
MGGFWNGIPIFSWGFLIRHHDLPSIGIWHRVQLAHDWATDLIRRAARFTESVVDHRIGAGEVGATQHHHSGLGVNPIAATGQNRIAGFVQSRDAENQDNQKKDGDDPSAA